MTNNKLSISSYLSMGATDGPGVRTVFFLNGCTLRCEYCHNPETWEFKKPDSDIDELVKKVLRYKPYYRNGGGVTVSGGEPLYQQNAVASFFKKLNENDIHTCLDTSACIEISDELLKYTDLILCDIKFLSGAEYEKYTGLDIFDNVKKLLEKSNKPVWIRHVLLPNVTDNKDYIIALRDFCSQYKCIKRIELLPFKNICSTKYEELDIDFKLKTLPLTDYKVVENLKSIVKKDTDL